MSYQQDSRTAEERLLAGFHTDPTHSTITLRDGQKVVVTGWEDMSRGRQLHVQSEDGRTFAVSQAEVELLHYVVATACPDALVGGV